MNRGLVRICFNFLNAAEPKKTWTFIVQLNCVTLLTIVATESGTAESQNTTAKCHFRECPTPTFEYPPQSLIQLVQWLIR